MKISLSRPRQGLVISMECSALSEIRSTTGASGGRVTVHNHLDCPERIHERCRAYGAWLSRKIVESQIPSSFWDFKPDTDGPDISQS